MTGYGLGSARLGNGNVSLEVRSLNHRYIDVRVRVPSELGEHAFYLEQRMRSQLDRGRFDVTVRLDPLLARTPGLDLDRARAMYRVLTELRDELAPGSELPIGVLTAFPDVLTQATVRDPDADRIALDRALALALERLTEMRSREGALLQEILSAHLSTADQICDAIAKLSAAAPDHYRARLRERLDRLLTDVGHAVDAARLESEVAFLADKSDIAEELARLQCHFEQFSHLLASDVPVGRRLDFLLQEVAREANTIGAKSADAQLSHLVVELKSEVERMREQVQNVE